MGIVVLNVIVPLLITVMLRLDLTVSIMETFCVINENHYIEHNVGSVSFDSRLFNLKS